MAVNQNLPQVKSWGDGRADRRVPSEAAGPHSQPGGASLRHRMPFHEVRLGGDLSGVPSPSFGRCERPSIRRQGAGRRSRWQCLVMLNLADPVRPLATGWPCWSAPAERLRILRCAFGVPRTRGYRCRGPDRRPPPPFSRWLRQFLRESRRQSCRRPGAELPSSCPPPCGEGSRGRIAGPHLRRA